jgi:hypothetical protein
MILYNKLRVTVEDAGVFVRFKASDGREVGMNMIETAKNLGSGFGRTIAQWCKDVIDEQPTRRLAPQVRDKLLAQVHSLSAGKDLDRVSGEACNSHSLPSRPRLRRVSAPDVVSSELSARGSEMPAAAAAAAAVDNSA